MHKQLKVRLLHMSASWDTRALAKYTILWIHYFMECTILALYMSKSHLTKQLCALIRI